MWLIKLLNPSHLIKDADVPTPKGARPSAGTILTTKLQVFFVKFRWLQVICWSDDVNQNSRWNSKNLVALRVLKKHSLQRSHNEHDGVSNHQRLDWLLNRLFRHRPKKTSKFRVTGLCEGNSPVTGEFPAQRTSNVENVFISWRLHDGMKLSHCGSNLCWFSIPHCYGNTFLSFMSNTASDFTNQSTVWSSYRTVQICNKRNNYFVTDSLRGETLKGLFC